MCHSIDQQLMNSIKYPLERRCIPTCFIPPSNSQVMKNQLPHNILGLKNPQHVNSEATQDSKPNSVKRMFLSKDYKHGMMSLIVHVRHTISKTRAHPNQNLSKLPVNLGSQRHFLLRGSPPVECPQSKRSRARAQAGSTLK